MASLTPLPESSPGPQAVGMPDIQITTNSLIVVCFFFGSKSIMGHFQTIFVKNQHHYDTKGERVRAMTLILA